MCKDYQGWKNYPTWAIQLWLFNDQATYNFWVSQAKAYQGQEGGKWKLADAIKESLETDSPFEDSKRTADVYNDLLTWAISQADYGEIAEAFLEVAGEGA